ncbi:hypothetical protein RRF57_006868 [Xylaria bambusicola]|uniref:Uncharacterized protein n=1 Tax=Xylaria bambusicola TaxID=326684 RepID=A0AAN7UJZ4_9PEZI
MVGLLRGWVVGWWVGLARQADASADVDLSARIHKSKSVIQTKYESDGDSELWSTSAPPSIVFSNQSESGATSQSSRPEIFVASTDHLAYMFLEDIELKELFKSALDDPKIGGEKLERNFSRILVAYSKELQAIAATEPQRQAVNIVKRGATSIARSIRRAINPEPVTTLANIKATGDDTLSRNTSKLTTIEEFLRKLPSKSTYDPNLSDDSIPNYYKSDVDFPPPDDSIESERGSDDDFKELEINPNGHDDFPTLRQVEDFLKSGLPIANLRERLKNFVFPAAHARPFGKTIETKDNIIPDIKAKPESDQRSEETCCQGGQLAFSKDPAIDLNCTNEELEVMKLFQDLFFLPQSLPEFIDMIFDLFKIPSAEEPELPSKTRVRWKCQCGTQLYDDFSELVPDSLSLLQLQLQQTKDAQSSAPRNIKEIIQAWIKDTFSVARRMIPGKVHSASGRQQDTGLPLHSLNSPTTKRQGLQASGIDLHLMLCIGKGQELPTFYQASVSNVSNDEQLFQFLRTQYWKLRNLPSWFTFRCVKRLSLTQFEVDANDFAMLDPNDGTCNPQCTCLPPVGRITGNEYCCSPAPETPLPSHPAISPKVLTHYFKKMHAFKKLQTKIYKQLPKRTSKLDHAGPDDTRIAWGIHFEEGWHWRTVYFLVFLSTSCSLAFGVAWAVVKKSIGDAFTAASFGATICSALIALLAWASMDA